MSNPYSPPRAEPSTAALIAADDDPELARLRKRLQFCGVAIAFVFGAVGIVQTLMISLGAIHGFLSQGHIVIFLLVVGGFAALGRPAAIYFALAVAASWLAFLTINLPFELYKDDFVGPELTLAIYGVLATPGLVTALFAVCGIAMDVAMRRRRAILLRFDGVASVFGRGTPA